MDNNSYKPALRFHWLTRYYDSLAKITFPEKKIKNALIKQAAFNKDDRVLDFGVGTATLSIMMQQQFPLLDVTGLDVDAKILSIAKEKIKKTTLPIHLQQYDGEHFPFENSSFDKVISSLVFHHLTTSVKTNVLKEIFRVLKPGGELHITDFGRSESWLQRALFNLIRGLDGFASTDANAKGLLLQLISEAGFENAGIKKHFKTIFGEVQIISAAKL